MLSCCTSYSVLRYLIEQHSEMGSTMDMIEAEDLPPLAESTTVVETTKEAQNIQIGERNEMTFHDKFGQVTQVGPQNTINIFTDEFSCTFRSTDVKTEIIINVISPNEDLPASDTNTLMLGETFHGDIEIRVDLKEKKDKTSPSQILCTDEEILFQTRSCLSSLFRSVNMAVQWLREGSIIIGLQPTTERAVLTLMETMEEGFLEALVQNILENQIASDPDCSFLQVNEPIKMKIEVNIPKAMFPKNFSCRQYSSMAEIIKELKITIRRQEFEKEYSRMATPGKLIDEFLTCSICMEGFQQPATLACQHSYCQSCLTKYLQTQPEAVITKSIPCPSCRQQTPVPHPDRPVEEWVGQLKPGLPLTGLMDSCIHDAKHCSLCKEDGQTTQATHWCQECEAVFCDNCLKLHKKIPVSRHHEVLPLSGEVHQIKFKKKFVCKDHDEKMKLFCKDCNKPICTVCCGVSHRMCKDVITSHAMLPEVKHQLQQRQQKIKDQIDDANIKISGYQLKMDKISARSSIVKSEIMQTFQSLREKEAQLVQKLADLTEQQTAQFTAQMKSKKLDVETYQQQSEFIKQALKLEDEAQLFEMYLSGPGTETNDTKTQREDRFDVADIRIIRDLGKLREEMDKMGIKIIEDVNVLISTPTLHEVIETNLGESCNLRDVVVVKVKDTKVTVVSDGAGNRVMSVYTKNGVKRSSHLLVDDFPWSVTVLNDCILAVTVPYSKKIIKVRADPDLKLLSTITTLKMYYGLDVLDQSTLVASTFTPPCVDVLDMEGRVIRSIQTLPSPNKSFMYPCYLHVTSQGTILVSDWDLKSVICLTEIGDVVFTYSPTRDRALKEPRGFTSTSTGDILVADYSAHKVIHLSESGEFNKDILTSQDGIEHPVGLCIDEDKLYVAEMFKGVKVFQFPERR